MRYIYRQNNSGGVWYGPHEIVVEANSNDEADAKACENGAYFDGVEEQVDCECCGDRWSRTCGPDEVYEEDD